MIALDCNQPTFFDVDDTLILWNPTKEQIEKWGIQTWTPEGHETFFVPHLPHIEQLKRHALRGHTVIVWSAGGSEWAKRCVQLLHLQDYVSITMAKPLWSYDDKQPEEFMPRSQYLKVQSE